MSTDREPVDCDRCGADIQVRGWVVPTGRVDEELNLPVVEFVCQRCYDAEESERS